MSEIQDLYDAQKPKTGKWEPTAGSILAGENSVQGACRELIDIENSEVAAVK